MAKWIYRGSVIHVITSSVITRFSFWNQICSYIIFRFKLHKNFLIKTWKMFIPKSSKVCTYKDKNLSLIKLRFVRDKYIKGTMSSSRILFYKGLKHKSTSKNRGWYWESLASIFFKNSFLYFSTFLPHQV